MAEPSFKFEKGVPIVDKTEGGKSIGDKPLEDKERANLKKKQILFDGKGGNYTPSEVKKIQEQRKDDPNWFRERE